MPASNTHPNTASKRFFSFIVFLVSRTQTCLAVLLRAMMMVPVVVTRGSVGRHGHSSKQCNGERP